MDDILFGSGRKCEYFENKIEISAGLHIGNVREKNEDGFSVNGVIYSGNEPVYVDKLLDGKDVLLMVCDGMGGEGKGDMASKIALAYSSELFEDLKIAQDEMIYDIVENYVKKINDDICLSIGNTVTHRGGSTLALVYIRKGIMYSFSMGDSRIYLYDGEKLEQISTDHTVAMKKYLLKIYTLEEAENSIDKNKLTLFLGADVEGHGINAESYESVKIKKGQIIIICSDGLYNMCTEEVMRQILNGDSNRDAKSFVDFALRKGGEDNITCILVKI